MSIPDLPQPVSALDDAAYVDYFGFAESHKHYLDDGRQYFEFQTMNEGQKAQFQSRTQRDVIVARNSGDARMKMDPAKDRHELIRTCVTGWNLYRGGTPVPYTERAMKDFLELANPKVVEDLEKAIQKANPWLLAEMSSEDIQREIDNLTEMLTVAQERERGE